MGTVYLVHIYRVSEKFQPHHPLLFLLMEIDKFVLENIYMTKGGFLELQNFQPESPNRGSLRLVNNLNFCSGFC